MPYGFERGHRERCSFVTRCARCDCEYVPDLEKRFASRWRVDYWTPGQAVYDHYAKKVRISSNQG